MEPIAVGTELYGFRGSIKANRIVTVKVVEVMPGGWLVVECVGGNQKADAKLIGRRWMIRAEKVRASDSGQPCFRFDRPGE